MLKFLSKIYGSVVESKNRNYDSGKKEIVKCNVPVISVGNLTTGGTGKTPFVIFLANMLIESGFRPVIIGRGYRKKRRGYILVSDGNYIVDDPDLAGDEMFLIAKKVKAPVVAHENKSEAAQIAEKHLSPDLIIIDDGFQHRNLHRDIDILLIDNNTVKEKELLPAGSLREPISSASRADLIVEIGIIENQIEFNYNKSEKQKIFRAEIIPEPLMNLNGSSLQNEINKDVITISGIANPQRFESSIKSEGFNIVKHIKFRDHKRYTQNDLKFIIQECDNTGINRIITTEKDAVKLNTYKSNFEKNHIDCYIYPIRIEIIEKKKIFRDYILSKIEENKGNE
ncbi:MAG: tetraacyldisaccharide 4'-kinase [Ignavibacteriae bacterium]|nr:tetraacyldisaccharide 4'-kinase [Ignavibacteriota bacterium]